MKVLEDQDGSVKISHIQFPERQVVGVLLGVVPKGTTLLEDIRKSLLCHPKFKKKQIDDLELEIGPFKIQQRFGKDEPRVGVVHVLARSTQSLDVLRILKRIYPSKPKPQGTYPLGVQYRFTIKSARLISKKHTQLASNLHGKLKLFNETVDTMEYAFIKNIHCPHMMISHITLNKIISSMSSMGYQHEGRPLILAIEQDYENGPTIFHYQRDLEQEVKERILTLPIMLKAGFGEGQARDWFNEGAWRLVEGYTASKIDEDNAFKGIRIKTNNQETWGSEAPEWDPMGQTQVMTDDEDDDIITNFDLIDLERKADHILGDEGMSTHTQEGYYDDIHADDSSTEATEDKPNAIDNSTEGETSSITEDSAQAQMLIIKNLLSSNGNNDDKIRIIQEMMKTYKSMDLAFLDSYVSSGTNEVDNIVEENGNGAKNEGNLDNDPESKDNKEGNEDNDPGEQDKGNPLLKDKKVKNSGNDQGKK